MNLKKDNGLTLPEITIVILLFSIILAAILNVLGIARTSWNSSSSQLTVQQEARKGLNSMHKELRQAKLSAITGVPADGTIYNSITFQIPLTVTESGTTWSTNIQYSLGGLNSSQLIRTQDTSQTVLANNISALGFTRLSSAPDTINITITVQKNTFPGFTGTQTNLTLNSQVKARNL